VNATLRFLATCHPAFYLVPLAVAGAVAVYKLHQADLADQRRRREQALAVARDAERRRMRHPADTSRQDFAAWEREWRASR
jgi:hypothetical protein